MQIKQNKSSQASDKKNFLFYLWMAGLIGTTMMISCSGNETSAGAQVDSTVEVIDSTAEAVFDSTKKTLKNIKSSLDSTFNDKEFK